jgi:hypothetical protein
MTVSFATIARALATVGTAAVLAGCKGFAGGTAPASVPAQGVALSPLPFAAARTPAIVGVPSDARRSWMKSRAFGPLLYVSDSQLNVVLAYTWPKLHLVGNLSGLRFPQGECVDRSGNVWVANTKRSEMVEFAHGRPQPIKTLADPGEYPSGCSVGGNGDLAVANIVAKRGRKAYGPGSISIYKGATGKPKVFSDGAFSRVFFDGYDSHGNLFLDGEDSSNAFVIAEFDGKAFTPLTVSGATINAPGSVQVTGSYVNVEDQLGAGGNSVMYQTTLSGSTLTVTATAQLLGGLDCVQSFVDGAAKKQRVICPDAGTPSINVYEYPAGGSPIETLYQNVLSPTGSVVSP